MEAKLIKYFSHVKLTADHNIVLTVNTTRLPYSGSWVNVSWNGVSNPKKSDWIGVYSPPIDNSIDPSYYAPVKYQVSVVCNGLSLSLSLSLSLYIYI